MNRPSILFAAGTIVAVALVVTGLLIRDGLLTLSAAVREKPMPTFPQQLHLMAGDSRLNLSVGTVQVEPSEDHTASLIIDNLNIRIPATQPATPPAK